MKHTGVFCVEKIGVFVHPWRVFTNPFSHISSDYAFMGAKAFLNYM